MTIFRQYGYIGAMMAFMVVFLLAFKNEYSPIIISAGFSFAIFVFYFQTMITKMLTGREQWIFYRYAIGIIIAVIFFSDLLELSILKNLDYTAISLTVFLIFGRIGCHKLGCCHGRPSQFGIIYSDSHVALGFPNYYAEIPIFPIQLLESLCATILAIIQIYWFLNGVETGIIFSFFIIAYGFIRFYLEYYRGDTTRNYFFYHSEAQWTSVILILVIVVEEGLGLLPWQFWHVPALLVMCSSIIVVMLDRWIEGYDLLHPQHVSEVAEVLVFCDQKTKGDNFSIYETSCGLLLSKEYDHYILSHNQKILGYRQAKRVFALILNLKKISNAYIFQEDLGVFHLVIETDNDISL